jgi:hypothetical protein
VTGLPRRERVAMQRRNKADDRHRKPRFPDRDSALMAETMAIKTEYPLFNQQLRNR